MKIKRLVFHMELVGRTKNQPFKKYEILIGANNNSMDLVKCI